MISSADNHYDSNAKQRSQLASSLGVALADVRHLFEGVPERSLSRQYRWDNSGVQLVCHDNAIAGVTICLDITPNVLSSAVQQGNNLIISHHPLIFTPLKSITNTTATGSMLLDAVRNNINILSYHTNLDLADYSLADYLLDRVGLPAGSIYEQVGGGRLYTKTTGSGAVSDAGSPSEDTPFDAVPYGLGRVVDLPTPMGIDEVKRLFVDTFGLASGGVVHNLPDDTQTTSTVLPNGRTPLSMNTKFHRLAIVPGSGFASWEQCLSVGADILVSGDLKHHQALDAKMAGVATLDIGHEASEMPFLYHIKAILSQELNLHGEVVADTVMHRHTDVRTSRKGAEPEG